MAPFASPLSAGADAPLATSPRHAGAGAAARRAPELATFASLVEAGGGAATFKTLVFLTAVAGPDVNADVAELTKQRGAAAVKRCIASFDFAIADTLRLLAASHTALPAAVPAPTPPRELARALYAAGVAGADRRRDAFRAATMFDTLVSEPRRAQIERDVAAKYGARATADCALALERFMQAVKSAYAL